LRHHPSARTSLLWQQQDLSTLIRPIDKTNRYSGTPTPRFLLPAPRPEQRHEEEDGLIPTTPRPVVLPSRRGNHGEHASPHAVDSRATRSYALVQPCGHLPMHPCIRPAAKKILRYGKFFCKTGTGSLLPFQLPPRYPSRTAPLNEAVRNKRKTGYWLPVRWPDSRQSNQPGAAISQYIGPIERFHLAP